MAETTKKTQTLKKKPVAKVTKKTPVKKIAVKSTTKTAVKPVKKVTAKAPAKVAKKTPAKTPAKAAVKPVNKAVRKTPVKKVAVKSPVKTAAKTVKKGNFLTSLLQNLNFIKLNFLDVFLLFKNFIHWNISKLIIFVWSVILGLITIIPLIIVLLVYSSMADVEIMMLINGTISGDIINYIIGYAILFIIAAIFFIFFSYSNILLIKVNNSYLKGKKLGYKANEYFNVKRIVKFFNLSLLNISILLIPVLLFFVLMGILFLVSGSLEDINQLISGGMLNYFSILSLLIFIVTALVSVYLSYRVIFSYIIFSDSKYYNVKNKAISYIKESFNKTKKVKNFFKFVAIFIVFSLLIFPINYYGDVLEKNDKNLNVYNMFLNLSEEQQGSITGDDLYYIESLKLDYEGLTTDEVNIKIKLNDIYITLFSIFDFIFLYGLFVMITLSFYKRELV